MVNVVENCKNEKSHYERMIKKYKEELDHELSLIKEAVDKMNISEVVEYQNRIVRYNEMIRNAKSMVDLLDYVLTNED